uniref:Uncharacterized protein n=1 Tax=Knipowitschia caucasica TaxID=637954 RepID=A0AAV2IUP8_KNICA
MQIKSPPVRSPVLLPSPRSRTSARLVCSRPSAEKKRCSSVSVGIVSVHIQFMRAPLPLPLRCCCRRLQPEQVSEAAKASHRGWLGCPARALCQVRVRVCGRGYMALPWLYWQKFSSPPRAAVCEPDVKRAVTALSMVLSGSDIARRGAFKCAERAEGGHARQRWSKYWF